MATIARVTLQWPPGGPPWEAIVAAACAWADRREIVLRDAVVLLPFAQLLAPARRAFARAGGWMPRIETTRTLASALGPGMPAGDGQLVMELTTDTLNAAAMLRTRPWGAAWARRDPPGFAQAVDAVVASAQALARAAFACPPHERAAYWADARLQLGPRSGPGATERLLARVALEWACTASAPATDHLYGLTAVSTWIAVQAGGPDPLTMRVLADSAVPALVIDTDAPTDDPFARIQPALPAPAIGLCTGFEDEAQCAAAQVRVHLHRGETPVALIAQDRALVRRVRALLDREPVRVADETGWRLSTTRAAARVATLLRAARPSASTDDLIDWLKTGTAWPHAGEDLAALEAVCRRDHLVRVAALADADLDPSAARLWSRAEATLAGVRSALPRPLAQWRAALRAALADCGALAALRGDDAGAQVLVGLRLDPRAAGEAAATHDFAFEEFVAWVEQVLERTHFLPSAEFESPAEVVITPLARAILRPFAAVVFPGADDRHLGVAAPSIGLIGDAQAMALGLPTAAEARAAELSAFAQVLLVPRVTLLRRRADGPEPLAESPLLERLAAALARRGAALSVWADPRVECALVPTPIHAGAPIAPDLLPARVSASACEALRACPYRFFALRMLRLREDDELEREVEKRDYGNWLHALLYEFHRTRTAPGSVNEEVGRLHALAAASLDGNGKREGAAGFLPYLASFASLAPRYVAWLHGRDRAGARWCLGEYALSAKPPALDGVEMHGIIDRVDRVTVEGAEAFVLIDYKTGSSTRLKEQVKQPFEDTQLAFYAALMGAGTDAPLQAQYLALDGTRELEDIVHPDVQDSAAALVAGLAHDLARLRAGAGLPPLGEGAVCDYCAARGLCRRDHWSAGVPPGDGS
jgi:ATP-dependent helicase/nuclease subunit B